ARAGHGDPIHVDRPRDVLDALLAEIFEFGVQSSADLVAHRGGDTDAAGLSERLQARGNVDAIAKDVVAFHDHVAKIDADAKLDRACRRDIRIAPGHLRLDLGSALHRVDDALELYQQPVTGGLDDAPTMSGDRGVDQFQAVCL